MENQDLERRVRELELKVELILRQMMGHGQFVRQEAERLMGTADSEIHEGPGSEG